jgi:hypothetical protein
MNQAGSDFARKYLVPSRVATPESLRDPIRIRF